MLGAKWNEGKTKRRCGEPAALFPEVERLEPLKNANGAQHRQGRVTAARVQWHCDSGFKVAVRAGSGPGALQ